MINLLADCYWKNCISHLVHFSMSRILLYEKRLIKILSWGLTNYEKFTWCCERFNRYRILQMNYKLYECVTQEIYPDTTPTVWSAKCYHIVPLSGMESVSLVCNITTRLVCFLSFARHIVIYIYIYIFDMNLEYMIIFHHSYFYVTTASLWHS